MNYQSHKKRIEKTAHYYTIGNAEKSVKKIWIVCHGYGQLASRIIQKFSDFDPAENFILAPEGLHRFYWKGFSNDVVASWMTKADRLDEIADYCNWLQLLYDEYVPKMSDDVEIILFGFSQGCATQVRWIVEKQPHFHRLILWAGLLPEDLDYSPLLAYFGGKRLDFIYGDMDQFLTKDKLEQYKAFVAGTGLTMHYQEFEGKHEVHREMLKRIKDEV